MKHVGLLTDFYSADPSYSICIVIEEQLRALLRHGYKPVAIVEDIFTPARVWKEIELRRIPSGIKRSNNVEFYEGWQGSVKAFKSAFDEILDDLDVIITHDIVYQASCVWHNLAMREYAKEHPDKTWLHWVHSATKSPVWSSNDRRLREARVHMPNSKIVYPNAYAIPMVARAFNCEMDDVAVVPHTTDAVNYLGLQGSTKNLVDKVDLLDADAILVYPIRLDRGKQVEHVIRIGAALANLDKKVRIIIVDFHSTGGDKVTYRNELMKLVDHLGMEEHEVTFTSQANKDWKLSVPRETVRDLFLLSNVFVMPSKSETYSLIAQEAALCGNFLVLNFDFPPMRGIYGEHAAYYKFSSNIDMMSGLEGTTDTEHGDIDLYCYDIALRIAYELENNHVLAQKTRVRKERNPDYVFRNFMEPLFCCFDGGAQ